MRESTAVYRTSRPPSRPLPSARDGRRVAAPRTRRHRRSTWTGASAWPTRGSRSSTSRAATSRSRDERGRYWVMQNGEIYNYVELRAELERLGHRFTTTSRHRGDRARVRGVGAGCLDRFNGDFAIAVWDRETRRAASWRATASACVRSSSPSTAATSASPPRPRRCSATRPRGRELDPVGIVDDVHDVVDAPDRSAFDGIRELPPAHYVAASARTASGRQTRWWDIDFAPVDAARGRARGRARGAARRCDRIRLRADVPVGAYLSGGLDSSAIAAIARGRSSRDDSSAFGLGFSDERFDESALAGAIARRARGRPPPHRRRRCGDRRASSPRGRAGREADAADRAGAAAARCRRGAGGRAQGRAHGRGRGRALRRLRHLPRGQGPPVLGPRPVVAAAAAAVPAAQPIPGCATPTRARRVPGPLLRTRPARASTIRSTAIGSASRTRRAASAC